MSIELPTPSRPWSAFLRTGQGKVVRTPQFIGPCANCGEPAAFWLGREERQPLRLSFECASPSGCRSKGGVEVDMRPAREGA